ncbi:MAG TPA: hypothetical protein VKV38_15280 [Trebonia sp.]|nr:hypothetical protein [Trebonia sp.]
MPGLHRCRTAGDRAGPAPAGPAQPVRVPGRGRSRHRRPRPAGQETARRHGPALLKVIAEWRNRIETTFSETTFSETTGHMELARHGAHTFWGLPARIAATIAARTLQLACLTQD